MFGPLLLGAALVPAVAGALPHPQAPAGAIEILRPRDGEVVDSGERVLVEWAPGPSFAKLGTVEEWEVFLSLDGGRRFSIRLTPHLDAARRRVEVKLPDFGPGQARLLWRFGDEEQEVELLWGGTLEVRRGARRAEIRPTSRFAAGEPARVGAAPVWAWVEGRRDGSGWVEVEGAARSSQVGHVFPALAARRSTSHAIRSRTRPRAAPPLESSVESDSQNDRFRGDRGSRRRQLPVTAGPEVRCLISRWNE